MDNKIYITEIRYWARCFLFFKLVFVKIISGVSDFIFEVSLNCFLLESLFPCQ